MHRLSLVATCTVAVLAASACDSPTPTAPDAPVVGTRSTLAVTESGVEARGKFVAKFKAPRTRKGRIRKGKGVLCKWNTRVTARGGPDGEYLVWRNAELEWRYADGTRFTSYRSQDDLIDFWGSDRLYTGRKAKSGRWNYWSGTSRVMSFTLVGTFRYEVQSTGEVRSTRVYTQCNLPPGSASPDEVRVGSLPGIGRTSNVR
jgi:hypothetical protein